MIKNFAIRLSMELGYHHVYTWSDASNGDIGTIVDIEMHDRGRACASLMYCVDSKEARKSSMTQGEDKSLLPEVDHRLHGRTKDMVVAQCLVRAACAYGTCVKSAWGFVQAHCGREPGFI